MIATWRPFCSDTYSQTPGQSTPPVFGSQSSVGSSIHASPAGHCNPATPPQSWESPVGPSSEQAGANITSKTGQERLINLRIASIRFPQGERDGNGPLIRVPAVPSAARRSLGPYHHQSYPSSSRMDVRKTPTRCVGIRPHAIGLLPPLLPRP